MIIDWLYQATIDMSLLIGLILILRTLVRRSLGAQAVYWLWSLPVLRILLPHKVSRPDTLIDSALLPGYDPVASITQISSADVFTIPQDLPLVGLWYAGIVFCVLVQLILNWRFRKTLKHSSDHYENLSVRNQRLIESCGFNTGVVIQTSLLSGPIVTGLIRPKIYLPVDFLRRFSEDEQLWVIKHELAHIKRRDLWLQFIAELVRTIFWFNPIVHLAIRIFREDQEYACDQSVLSECSTKQRYQYGKALLAGSSSLLVPSALTFFSKSKERFIMLNRHKNSRLNSALGLSLCLIVGLFAFTSAPKSIAQTFTISDIIVYGHQRISAGVIYGLLPVKLGDVVSNDVPTQQITQDLVQSGYFDMVEATRQGTNLMVRVVERPLVSEITVDGNTFLQTQDIIENMGSADIAEGKIFTRAALEVIHQGIRDVYLSRGRYGAAVEIEVEELSQNKIAISLDISEGEESQPPQSR